jgi:hypothetical protein
VGAGGSKNIISAQTFFRGSTAHQPILGFTFARHGLGTRALFISRIALHQASSRTAEAQVVHEAKTKQPNDAQRMVTITTSLLI